MTLVSGNGAAGSQDPNVTVEDSCTGTTAQATIVPTYSLWADPISGTQWDSVNAGYDGCNETFTTTFTLPAGATGPTITVSDLADNSSNVSLNGNQPFITGNVPGQCEAAFQGPPASGSTASGFVAGTNTLTFDVDNCYPAEGQSPTGIDFVATVTYGTAGTSVPALSSSYTGTATNTTYSANGDLTLTGISESTSGRLAGDATFDNGLVGGGAFAGTVSGSSVDLTIISATPSSCFDECVAITLTGTIGSGGALSGSYVVYAGSGTESQGTWQVSPEAAPTKISTAIAVSNPVAGAAGVTDTVDLTAGPKGALTAGSSTIAIGFPPGTGAGACSSISVADVTSGASGSPASCSDSDGLLAFSVPVNVAGGDQVQIELSDATNSTATGNYTVAISTSSDDLGTASFALVTGGTLSGTVEYQTSSGLQPVAGSIVQACQADSCYTSTAGTGSDGSFSFLLPVGSYTITAFAPTSNAYSVGEGSAGPVAVTLTGPNTVTVTLPAIPPLPAGVTFNGETSTVGNVFWGSAAPVSVTGCDDGAGLSMVTAINTQTDGTDVATGPLTESPAGSGVYTATIPALYPAHGTASDVTAISCYTPSALLPVDGPDTGGNEVEINGTGFTGATAVKFGSVRAESFTVVSDTEIAAIAPPGSGSVPVTVNTPGGTIASAALATYTYLTVSAVSPASGPAGGGTAVTIVGSDLTETQAVYFGDVPAANVAVVSSTEITATAPPGTGSVPVTVLTADGGVSATTAPLFTYGTPAAAGPASRSVIPLDLNTAVPVRSATSDPAAAGGSIGEFIQDKAFDYAEDQAEKVIHYVANRCAQGYDFDTALAQAWRDYQQNQGVWTQEDYQAQQNYQRFLQIVRQLYYTGTGAALAGNFLLDLLAQYGKSTAENAKDILDATKCFTDALPNMITDGYFKTKIAIQSFLFRIDPSGTVEDTNGNPVNGVTVTLLESPDQLGPFNAPPAGSPLMTPSVNPETTGADGIFHWDVVAGYYEITATKPGCHEPGHPSQATVTSPVFKIPPPAVGIVLVLQCADEAKPGRPAVTGLSVASGPATGATMLDVAGTRFTPGSVVRFGAARAATVKVLGPTDILVTAPRGRGTVAVTVTTPGGTSATTAKDRFTYISAPTVTRISPAHGPARGGTTVTITGHGFAAGDQVAFGGTAAPTATILSGTEIVATSPAGAGTVMVTVSNVDGPSGGTAATAFSYAGKPLFSSRATAAGTKGKKFFFTITAGGYPAPAISESGQLPPGVKFIAQKAGTATLSGTPTRSGRYALRIKARNSYGYVTQDLVITVRR